MAKVCGGRLIYALLNTITASSILNLVEPVRVLCAWEEDVERVM